MIVIEVLPFFFPFLCTYLNMHGSLENHSLVIRIPWINKVIFIIIFILLLLLVKRAQLDAVLTIKVTWVLS